MHQAYALLDVAELVQQDPSYVALPSVTASLAGIAASDAACSAALRRRPRGQNRQEAVAILATVNPGGNQMSQDLGRLVAAKDDSHYRIALVNATKLNSCFGQQNGWPRRPSRLLIGTDQWATWLEQLAASFGPNRCSRRSASFELLGRRRTEAHRSNSDVTRCRSINRQLIPLWMPRRIGSDGE